MPPIKDHQDGTGYHAGSFWFLQEYEFGGFYDSNVFAEPNDPQGGFGGYIQSNLTAKSDWGQHGVQVRLFSDYYHYFEPADENLNRADVLGEVRGFVDITHDTVLNGGVTLQYDQLAPGDVNAPLTAEEVTPVAQARVWGELTKQFNRLYASIGADFEPQQYGDNPESRFGDDLLINTNGLDGFAWSGGGRLGYEVSPGYRVWGDVRYNQERWDHEFENTNSEGISGLVGASFEVTRLITGEIGVGYFQQWFEDNEFENPNGFDYHAALIWNPTPLVAVTLAADRTIEPESIEGIAGSVQDAASLTIAWEATHALTLTPVFRVYNDDYIEEKNHKKNEEEGQDNIDIEDFAWQAGISADYALNRLWSVGAHYTFTERDAEADDVDLGYERHFVGVYAKARL